MFEDAPPVGVFETTHGAALVRRGGHLVKVVGFHVDFASAPALSLAIPVDGSIDRNPSEPSARFRARVDALRLLKEFDEGILNHLKRVFRVA